MTKRELTKLKGRIGKDYLQALHLRTGKAKSTIFHVLRGDWPNQEIIDTAFTILEERRVKEKQQLELLHQ